MTRYLLAGVAAGGAYALSTRLLRLAAPLVVSKVFAFELRRADRARVSAGGAL